eukprot:COSAG02_NODE_60035_length_272_cov_0.895954_1_plen_26_part_10
MRVLRADIELVQDTLPGGRDVTALAR